jgi:glycosyltransferase involved in cell wall biosynthesis
VTADEPPLIVHIFPTFAVGGAQVRFAAIANHFGRAFRHIIVSLDGNLACRERLDPGLDATFPTIQAQKNAMLSNAWRYRSLLRQWHPDTLVTCNWGAIEFALANLLPVTRHLHITDGFGPEERNTQLPRRVLIRRLALSFSPAIFPSRTLVRIAKDIWKLPPSRIRYVPNGIDLDRFASGGSRGGGPDPVIGPPVIGTVAALREEKNLSRLIRAVATLPAGRLVIVGEGPEREALTGLAASLGIADRVTFAGHRQDTPDFYASFDIFALSSDTEQMPLSVIEAMASGLPVVSTDVGDVKTMVSEANARFVTPMDAFAAALGDLAADPALRTRLGADNLAKAHRDFDQAAMFATYGALWRGETPPR